MTDHQTLSDMPAVSMTNQEAKMNRMGVPTMPMRNASAGLELERERTIPMPTMEQMSPVEASANGRNISAARPSPSAMPGASAATAAAARVDAIAMVAIMEPQ